MVSSSTIPRSWILGCYHVHASNSGPRLVPNTVVSLEVVIGDLLASLSKTGRVDFCNLPVMQHTHIYDTHIVYVKSFVRQPSVIDLSNQVSRCYELHFNCIHTNVRIYWTHVLPIIHCGDLDVVFFYFWLANFDIIFHRACIRAWRRTSNWSSTQSSSAIS